MKTTRAALLVALAPCLAAVLVLWRPGHATAAGPAGSPGHDSDGDEHAGVPRFKVDASWPQALPSTIDASGVAHRWVAGEQGFHLQFDVTAERNPWDDCSRSPGSFAGAFRHEPVRHGPG